MKTLTFNLLLLVFAFSASAHEPPAKNKLLNPLKHLTWTVGLSGIVIDDDGQRFRNLFNVKDSWNSLYAPSRATLEGYIIKGWSAEVSIAYSKLKAGKIIDDYNRRRLQDGNLFTVDLNAKYYPFQRLLSDYLSPYAIMGLGYTNRTSTVQNNGMMLNIGLGLSVWLYKGFGLNVQSMAKFAVNANSSNYLMHSFGAVYRFKP